MSPEFRIIDENHKNSLWLARALREVIGLENKNPPPSG